MKLNGFDLVSYSTDKEDKVNFVLTGTTMLDALALDGQTLTVTQDDTEYAVFAGYRIMGVDTDEVTGYINVKAARSLPDTTVEAIQALNGNVNDLLAKMATVDESMESISTTASTAAQTASTAAQTAQEAKETAEQAGTSPSVKAAAVMFVNASTTLTNSELGDVRELIEDFKPGAEYAKGAIRRYDGKYYRMAQAINSTTSQTYQPGTGTESLYTLIDLAADGIRIWHAPTDATNSFALNEKAHYPDAEGSVYVSKRDGNTSEPTKDEWWALDEE